ncbi:MAG TPA: RHS repeat-associated core domain-containing protein, partial [bacterium]|nr:RHS repeat-associated core domain-containing protein [bacterium]
EKIISQTKDGQISFFLYDGFGSTRILTDLNGTSTDLYEYDAYGNITTQSVTAGTSYLYRNEQYDTETQTYYLRARQYSPETGRFTQMDSWGGSLSRPLSLNKYNYTESNPVMGIDPSGRFMVMEMMAMLAVEKVMAETAEPVTSNWLKPKGDAQIGYRQLDSVYVQWLGTEWIIGGDNPVDDRNNTVIAHQNIWFNMNVQVFWYYTDNIGYFADSVVRPDEEKFSKEDYVFDDKKYEAETLIKAIYMTKPKPYSLLGTNILSGKNQYNCQDWIEEVVYYYNKIKD